MIDDPWHSRPLDVHRWSDHAAAIALSDQLWEEFFPDLAKEDSRTGPKPKTSFRSQFRVVLLDLWVAWKEDPALSLGVPLSSNAWATTSRYNALHISKKVIPIIGRMRELGLVDFAKGSYHGPGETANRNSRIRAAPRLVAYFETCALSLRQVAHHPDQECIILKAKDDPADIAKPIEYEDTEQTVAMRAVLRDYNALLAKTFIDIPSLDESYVSREITSGPREGETERVSTEPARTFVRRIFSRGSWDLNGRFYGGWWQQVNRTTRSRIFLNDVPTIEVDYRGLHVTLLSHEQGVELVGDPYELPEGTLPGHVPQLQRAIVKQLVLTCINARSRPAAFAAFREGWPTGHVAKGMDNEELAVLLDVFIAKHPHLAGSICSDQGIRLMNVDSRIAERLIRLYTAAGIPILCVHDSFIVPYNGAKRLRQSMRHASRAVVGKSLEVDSKERGLDEMSDLPRDLFLDFVHFRQLARSPGYLRRLEEHEGLHGSVVVEGGPKGSVAWEGGWGGTMTDWVVEGL
jgi:hypothetical protein